MFASTISPFAVQVNLPDLVRGQREGWGAEREMREAENDRGEAPARQGKSRRGGEQRGRRMPGGHLRDCRAGGRQKEEKKERQGGREMDPGQTPPRELEGGLRAANWGGACFTPGQFGPAGPTGPSALSGLSIYDPVS